GDVLRIGRTVTRARTGNGGRAYGQGSEAQPSSSTVPATRSRAGAACPGAAPPRVRTGAAPQPEASATAAMATTAKAVTTTEWFLSKELTSPRLAEKGTAHQRY